MSITVRCWFGHDIETKVFVVRYWSVFEQRWVETTPNKVPDREIDAMNSTDRASIAAATEKKPT